MATTTPVTTLERASEILGVAIKVQVNGYRHIVFKTEKHSFDVFKSPYDGRIKALGEPKPWNYGSEFRRGRPRQIWVDSTTEEYLQTLRTRIIN